MGLVSVDVDEEELTMLRPMMEGVPCWHDVSCLLYSTCQDESSWTKECYHYQ